MRAWARVGPRGRARLRACRGRCSVTGADGRYGSSGEGKADKPEPSAEEIVKIDRQDGIAIVSLNRPTKLNALNMDMFRGILRATKELQVLQRTARRPPRCFAPGTNPRVSLPHLVRPHSRALQQDRDIAAVILRGEGRAFCAGLDFKNVLADPLSVCRLRGVVWPCVCVGAYI